MNILNSTYPKTFGNRIGYALLCNEKQKGERNQKLIIQSDFIIPHDKFIPHLACVHMKIMVLVLSLICTDTQKKGNYTLLQGYTLLSLNADENIW